MKCEKCGHENKCKPEQLDLKCLAAVRIWHWKPNHRAVILGNQQGKSW
jgi:hypothetical protein